MLNRERELLSIEKQNLQRELADAQESLRVAEAEIGRLKRADLTQRKGHESIQHLQTRCEGLNNINSMLKQELEAKDRALQEAEDRLRRQEESIKRAYTDCDVQHQKIKKREMVISRVLKRLENINAIAGITDENAFENENGHHEQHELEGNTRF